MVKREKKLLKRPTPLSQHTREVPEGLLSGDLDQDCLRLKELLKDADSLECRLIYTQGDRRAALFYFPNMVDSALVSQNIIRPLQSYSHDLSISYVAQAILNVPTYQQETKLINIADGIAAGSAALLLEGIGECLVLGVAKVEHRGIGRSESEDVLIGPHESFSEDIDKNLALLRRKLSSHDFKIKLVTIGKVSRSKVAVLFVESIANEKLVAEVEERLRRIDIDFISGASYLSDLICDEPSAILPLLRTTERPSRVVGPLMEGRVVILGDGDPSALIVPTFAPEFIQSSEDYFERPAVATFLRFIRLVGLFISVFMPATWIALVSFHHGIIPPPLFNSIVAGREGVPLPTIVEMLVLLGTFDIIVEASTRMPMRVGQALGIVGGIILGQAAVQAGLVSPAMVIVVSLTGLSIFTQPSTSTLGPIRLLKYPVLIMSSILGLFGLVWGLIFLVIQVVSMRSFGYPFMYPIAPFRWSGELDIFVRAPLFWQNKRPDLLASQNMIRMKATPPKPGKGEGDADSG